MRLGDLGLRPVPGIGEVLPHVRQILQLIPIRTVHRLPKLSPLLGGPKILDDEDRRLMKRKGFETDRQQCRPDLP